MITVFRLLVFLSNKNHPPPNSGFIYYLYLPLSGSSAGNCMSVDSGAHILSQSTCDNERFGNIHNSVGEESAYKSESSSCYKELHSSTEIPFPEVDFYDTQKSILSSDRKQTNRSKVERDRGLSEGESSMKKSSIQNLERTNKLPRSSFLDLNGGEHFL